jgi:hypothetical protein
VIIGHAALGIEHPNDRQQRSDQNAPVSKWHNIPLQEARFRFAGLRERKSMRQPRRQSRQAITFAELRCHDGIDRASNDEQRHAREVQVPMTASETQVPEEVPQPPAPQPSTPPPGIPPGGPAPELPVPPQNPVEPEQPREIPPRRESDRQ